MCKKHLKPCCFSFIPLHILLINAFIHHASQGRHSLLYNDFSYIKRFKTNVCGLYIT